MTILPAIELATPLTDEQLIERILDGDTAVFELLMRRHNQRLFRLARSVVRTNDQAEEVLQETYLRAFASLACFQGRSSVITWLSRIAFHEALRHKRRTRRHASPELDLDSFPMSDSSSDGPNPLIRNELSHTLTAALDSLPTTLRTVVMLRLVEGLSTRATAESLRMSEANVKVALHRARRQLADAIEAEALPKLREALTFGKQRCDHVIAAVFHRLAQATPSDVP